jgi:hypothetical protein
LRSGIRCHYYFLSVFLSGTTFKVVSASLIQSSSLGTLFSAAIKSLQATGEADEPA